MAKFGVRKPSIKKSVKARTTGKIKRRAKKAVIPMYGKKGSGWIKNPKKAAYNKVYNKTSVSVSDLVRSNSHKSKKSKRPILVSSSNESYQEGKGCCGCGFLLLAALVLPFLFPFFPIPVTIAFVLIIVGYVISFFVKLGIKPVQNEPENLNYNTDDENDDDWSEF